MHEWGVSGHYSGMIRGTYRICKEHEGVARGSGWGVSGIISGGFRIWYVRRVGQRETGISPKEKAITFIP